MICVWVILFLWGISACGEFAQAVRAETIQAADISEAVSSGDASAAEIQITDQLELTRLQDMVDAMLGENSFSVTDAFHRLLSGGDVLSEESVREFLHSLFFSGLEQEKCLLVKILLLLLFAAVFSGFAGVFDNGQIGEIQFLCGVSSCIHPSDEPFFQSERISDAGAWMDHRVYERTFASVLYGCGSSFRRIYRSRFLSGSIASGVADPVAFGECAASWGQSLHSSEICESSFKGRDAGKNGRAY